MPYIGSAVLSFSLRRGSLSLRVRMERRRIREEAVKQELEKITMNYDQFFFIIFVFTL